MGDSAYQSMLQDVRERSMPDVMHEYGGAYCLRFAVEDEDSFLLKCKQSLAHEVECAERMLESGVLGTRKDHGRKSQLLYA